jgi:hypothetical protein
VAPSTYNQTRCALKFFYQVTLGQERVFDRIVCQKAEKHLPVVLSQSEVVRFFGAIRKMKYDADPRTALGRFDREGTKVQHRWTAKRGAALARGTLIPQESHALVSSF